MAHSKKKKHHVVAWIVVSILVIVLVLPIPVFFVCFYDSSTSGFKHDENYSTESMFSGLAVNSLDNAPKAKGGKLSFGVTEDDLNELFYTLTTSFKDYVKDFNVSINDNEGTENDTYMFSVAAEAYGFKTRLYMDTSFVNYVNEDNHDEDAFVFQINDVKIAKVGGLKSLASTLLSKYLSEDSINTVFTNAGFNMKISFADMKITYLKSQLLSDINTQFLSVAGDYGTLATSLLQQCHDNNLFTYDFYSNKSLEISIPLENFETNAKYVTDDKDFGLNFSTYRDEMVTLLDAGIITDDATTMPYIFDYLVRGYDHASTDAQSAVASLDLSSIGIEESEKQTYAGVDEGKSDTDKKIMEADSDIPTNIKTQITPTNILNKKIAQLDEDTLNDVLATTDILGYCILMSQKVADNDYKLNYIAVDNYYVNIIEDHMYIVVGVNINGFETRVCLDYIKKGNVDYGITMGINEITFGGQIASDTMKSFFLDIIANSATNQGDWFSFDATTGDLTFSAAAGIEASGYKTQIDAVATAIGGSVVVNLVGTDLSSDGYLDVVISV